MNTISSNRFDPFIPHPILDNPTRMKRIIANPLYDKLTISRAAYIRKSERLNRQRANAVATPLKSLHGEQTITTPLATSNNRPESHSTYTRQSTPSFRLPTPFSANRISPKNIRLPSRSRSHSIQSSQTDRALNSKKPRANDSIRYVQSPHGFEVRRYSSPNWLSVDLLTKDACQSQEKTFREMLDKKEQEEHLLHSIYTTEYYSKRWHDLLQSYKQGYLTHAEWAKQNYQLYCLKNLYIQASKREQHHVDAYARNIRQRRARSAFNEWKEAKDEENHGRRQSRLNTANSQRTTEVSSFLSNASYPVPILNSTDDNNTTNRISILSNVDNELPRIPLHQPNISVKKTSNTLYLFDDQRWSLTAMLKRVVGLAEPLPSLPKLLSVNRHQ